MDAATKAVTIKFVGAGSIYPIEVFHKPFVGMVWLGAGILALGGFLSAYYRRRVVHQPDGLADESMQATGEKVLVNS